MVSPESRDLPPQLTLIRNRGEVGAHVRPLGEV